MSELFTISLVFSVILILSIATGSLNMSFFFALVPAIAGTIYEVLSLVKLYIEKKNG